MYKNILCKTIIRTIRRIQNISFIKNIFLSELDKKKRAALAGRPFQFRVGLGPMD